MECHKPVHMRCAAKHEQQPRLPDPDQAALQRYLREELAAIRTVTDEQEITTRTLLQRAAREFDTAEREQAQEHADMLAQLSANQKQSTYNFRASCRA